MGETLEATTNEFDESNEFADELFKFLKTRERSAKEVHDFLIGKKSEAESQKILASLKKRGLVNDKRFSESRVLSRVKMYQHGRDKIRNELLEHNIDENTIEEALTVVDNDVWEDNAKKIAKKYLGIKKITKKTAANLANKLLRLGYEEELAKKASKELGVPWPEDLNE